MRDDIEAALRGVIDPELNADIVELGMVSGIDLDRLTRLDRCCAHHCGLPHARPDRE